MSFRFTAALLASLTVAMSAHADGPGLGNLTYTAAEVFKPIAQINGALGAPRAHGTMHMHRGYLAIVYAPDSGKSFGGFSFFDMSNPRAPKLAFAKDDDETHPLREAHGYGFFGDLVFLQSDRGFHVWDWSDPLAPKKVGEAVLPGITASDYGTGSWWLSVQAPYVYLGGSGNGLYIVDISDPKNPKLADRAGKPNPISSTQLGGFRTGPVFAIGNLLVVTSNDEPGYTTMDIGDPVQPKILKTRKVGMPSAYSSIVNGNRIYGVGNDKKVFIHDISNPALMTFLGATPEAGDDKGGYLQIQDGFAHAGMGTAYAKFDVRNKDALTLVNTGTSGIRGRDEDFANPMANIVFVASDHGDGTAIIPHQAAPDTMPPEVNMVVPRNGASKQPITSRIGVTFTDAIDTRTLTESSFIVRKKDTTTPIKGKRSYGMQIANFAPDAPLEADVTYEVVIPEGAISDVAGNKTTKQFFSSFATGIGGAPGCIINAPASSLVGKSTTFKVQAPIGAGLTYSWDFGDGSNPTIPSASIDAAYTFKDPGHWTITLSVSSKDLETSCSLLHTVTHPLTALPPTKSSPIILDKARKRVWTVNPDADTVAAIGVDSLAKELEVPVGKHPRTLSLAPDGSIWVANEDDATISVLDGSNGSKSATVSLPYASRPYGVAFAPDGSAAYVTLGAIGRLAKIDAKSRAVTTLDVGRSPRGLAISGDSARAMVTRFNSPKDYAEASDVDLTTFTLRTTIELPFDKGPDSESSGRGVLNYISAIAITPDGRRAFFPAKKDAVSRGMFRDKKPLTFENTVRTVLGQIDLVKGEDDPLMRVDFNDRSLASDVALTKLGDIAFVATTGTNTVEVVDPFSGQVMTSIEKVGAAPTGVVLDETGTKLFVQAFLSRDVSVWDVKGIVELTDNQFKKLGVVKTVDKEPLAENVLLGKKIFYDASDERMSKDKYLSCATCHLDGGEDGRVYDFTDRGEGLRNTTTLLGKRGVGHGRLHWSANFDEVQDFEHDIRNAFLGTGFLPETEWATHNQTLGDKKTGLSAELDALSAYVTTLDKVHPSPFRNGNGSLTKDGLRGLKVFRSANCAKCHSGPDMTDSASGALHDVGTIRASSGKRMNETLTGIDTPTLRSIWETAPYLHDGSAETLMDVLTTSDPDGKHAGNLSDEQRAHLASYLQQIDDHDDSNLDPDALLDEGGCGCRTVKGQGAGSALSLLVVAALARRRRRSH
jgi:MYXO-CTERM domain-containing protein